MMLQITPIQSQSAIITSNCYLVRNTAGFFLIDTGIAKSRAKLLDHLQATGCHPGDLKLILLTHGDLDHIGNAAFLRQKFSSRIAMQREDQVNTESGDMFANKSANPVAKAIARALFFLFRYSVIDRFTPDVLLEDGQELASFGLDAVTIHVPGHSKGSIAFLTGEGDLFCGDLLENTKKPSLNSLADDPAQLKASFERLKGYGIKKVYPGHGNPFAWDELIQQL